VLWSSALPTQLLLDASDHEGRATALHALMDGTRFAFGHTDARDTPLTCTRAGNEWRLHGRKNLVMAGDSARRLLVSARGEDGRLALFDCPAEVRGLDVLRYRLHDGRGAADLVFDDVRLPASACISGPDLAASVIDEALAFATVMLCAESLGAMRKALALTVEYMRTRKQFGRSLAEYQALQHRVVEHYRNWMQASALVNAAATGWAGTSPAERGKRVSAAKWMTGRAGRAIALDTLQLHGAVGLQDETAISHYARRLVANDTLLGDATSQLARFIACGADNA
jgi:acyl-CoA dehydrogenase